MSTSAPAQLVYLANEWEKLFSSAAISGIVGDQAHKLRGGYHISIEDQPSNNYSVIRPDDKAPPGNWPRNMASAVDMTLGLADMKVCHARLKAAWANRANDPRMKYINAWNGWDGNGSPGRYDVVTGAVSTASDDHKWHVHLEIRRRYVNDRTAMNAVLSILAGEDGDMAFSADEKAYLDRYWVQSQQGGQPATVTTSIAGNAVLNQGIPNGVTGTKTYAWKAIQDLGTKLLDIEKAIAAKADVDEAALASALAGNAAFVETLASSVAAKVQGGEDLKAAVKEVLNETSLTVQ